MSTLPTALGVPGPDERPARTRGPRAARLDTPGAPTLTRGAYVWGEVWRVLVALLLGLMLLGLTIESVEAGVVESRFPILLAVDMLLGLASLGLLLLRRRAPLTIALVLAGFCLFAVMPSGASLIATISLATRRRVHEISVLGVVVVPNLLAYDWFYPPTSPLFADSSGRSPIADWVVELGLGLIGYALMVVIGAYIGARRDLVRSLRAQAAANQLDQARRADQARAAERERIAREMHDVLAHRMSLVAMHSGALAYRIDLSPDQVRETATIIRDGTHQALEELRGILGVLRATETAPPSDRTDGCAADHPSPESPTDRSERPTGRPERPQPTLDDLDELVASARSAGNPVRLDMVIASDAPPPAGLSRNAYRIVQEALTNARKHEPGSRVVVDLRGGPDAGLTIRVMNPVMSRGPRPVGGRSAVSGLPGAGMGLTGMAERAKIAGGSLTFGEVGGRFEVVGWLPWPT